MAKLIKILTLNNRAWATGGYASKHGFDVRYVEIGGPVPVRWDGKCSQDGIGQHTTRDGIERLHETVRKFKPHVIMFGIHHELPRETLDIAVKASGAKLVMHYTDQRVGVPKEVSKYSDSIDLLLLTNSDGADHAKYSDVDLRTDILWDGVEPGEYHPTDDPAEHDVFFGGNNFAGLIETIKKMRGLVRSEIPPGIRFPGGEFRDMFLREVADRYDLHIRGEHGWAGWKNVEPPVYHPNYLAELHKAKVILNTWNAPRRGLLTRRVWRSIASGRLFLTQYVHGMERVFDDGLNVAWFHTIEEGLDKLAWYLNHDDARRKVGINGARLVHRNHSCERRLIEFKMVLERNELL